MVNDQKHAKVSVLLPTFNRAHYVGAAINSLLSQTHEPFEIIVLDDGSTDETAEACGRFGERVKYVRIDRNGGKTAAINTGLALARGDFIWIMDDDDIVPPCALAILLAPLIAHADLGFSFGALRKFAVNENGGFRFDDAGRRPPGPRSLFAHLMEDCFITGQPCTLFRRSCLDALAPFDTRVVASVDYNILLQVARFHGGADVGQVVLWQRQHSGPRGPATLQYAAGARVDRWREFDQRLIADLMAELKLHEYLGLASLRWPLVSHQVRSAHVQKAVIAARKDIWDIAIASLREAVAAEPGKPFEPGDLETLGRMLGCRYGIKLFLGDPRLQLDLAKAAGEGQAGRQVRLSIASLLPFWIRASLRKADFDSAFRCFEAMLRLVGVGGAASLLAQAAIRRTGAFGLSRSSVRVASDASYAAE